MVSRIRNCVKVFLAVVDEHQNDGIGRRLLDLLIQRAREDDGIRRLVGRVVADGERQARVEGMVQRRGFTENRDFVTRAIGPLWILDVAAPQFS